MSFLLILLASFLFTGIVIRTKSIAQGRKGPSVWQPMYDIWKLLHKGSVYSTASSWIFKVAPTLYFASVVVACMVVPVANLGSTIGFAGDFIFFAYVLGFGKFFTIIGALDTASSFEGMGSAREALFSMLVEPAFFILIGSLGLLTGYTSFADIFAQFHFEGEISYAIAAIAAFVLLMICMIENSRMPVDDPKTHLELTMIHEVMVLDNSGVDMAMIHQSTNMKFALYSALIVNLFIGAVADTWAQIALFFGIEFLCAVMVGIIESFMARYRMTHNAQFILVLTSLALLLYFGIK
ncbi:MAG: NADH-quinone oxidoreductase subunit H [Bacteroidales bacterium]|nr:NADH-quinone oxidoreductase subunit H [Bacteroidales bacterium]